MKKLLLSFIIIIAGIKLTSAQDIPNAGFENWHPYTNGVYPDFWTTSDSIAVNNGGGKSVFDSTDAFEGSKCMHLKSVAIVIIVFNVSGPGIATNGQISFNGSTFQFFGGSPDTSRSRFFTARYKYFPTNGTDAAVVKVYLLKNNGGTRDTIADGITEISGTHSSYDQLVLAMNYRDFINQPDTSLIIIQSSRGINDPTLGVGSELVIDSLGFSGFVGVDELKSAISAANVYPSPANDHLNIDVTLRNNVSLSFGIYDMNGRMIKSAMMRSTNERIDVSDLSAGKYILKIGDAKLNQLYSTNFSIAR